MNKLNKTFVSGNVLYASELNNVTSKVDEIIDNLSSDYASLQWVQQQGYLTQHQPLIDYATKADLNNYVRTSDVIDAGDSDITTELVLQMIETQVASSLSNSNYATQSWVGQLNYLTQSDISDMATKTWVNNLGFLTQHQSLSDYATTSAVSDLADDVSDNTNSISTINSSISSIQSRLSTLESNTGSNISYSLTPQINALGREFFLEAYGYGNTIQYPECQLTATLTIDGIEWMNKVYYTDKQPSINSSILGANGSVSLTLTIDPSNARYCSAYNYDTVNIILHNVLKLSDVFSSSNRSTYEDLVHSAAESSTNVSSNGRVYWIADDITVSATFTYTKDGESPVVTTESITKMNVQLEEDDSLEYGYAILSDVSWSDFAANPSAYLTTTLINDSTKFKRYYTPWNQYDQGYYENNVHHVWTFVDHIESLLSSDIVVFLTKIDGSSLPSGSNGGRAGGHWELARDSQLYSPNYTYGGVYGNSFIDAYCFARANLDTIGDKYLCPRSGGIEETIPAGHNTSSDNYTIPYEITLLDFDGNTYNAKGGTHYKLDAFSGFSGSLWIHHVNAEAAGTTAESRTTSQIAD